MGTFLGVRGEFGGHNTYLLLWTQFREFRQQFREIRGHNTTNSVDALRIVKIGHLGEGLWRGNTSHATVTWKPPRASQGRSSP